MHRWRHVLGMCLFLPVLLLCCTVGGAQKPAPIKQTVTYTPSTIRRETYHWSMQYATDWEENGTFDCCSLTEFLEGMYYYFTDETYSPWKCETYFTSSPFDRAKEENFRDDLIYEEVIVRIRFINGGAFASYEERDEFLAEYCAIHAPEAELIPAIGLLRFENITFFQLRTLWKTFEGEKVWIFIAEEWEYESKFHRTLEEAQELIREGKLEPTGYNFRLVDGRVVYE